MKHPRNVQYTRNIEKHNQLKKQHQQITKTCKIITFFVYIYNIYILRERDRYALLASIQHNDWHIHIHHNQESLLTHFLIIQTYCCCVCVCVRGAEEHLVEIRWLAARVYILWPPTRGECDMYVVIITFNKNQNYSLCGTLVSPLFYVEIAICVLYCVWKELKIENNYTQFQCSTKKYLYF